MNKLIEMLLNYLDISKFLVILTIILIFSVSYLLLSSDTSIISDESEISPKKISSDPSEENKKKSKEIKPNKTEIETSKTIEIKGFHQNEINEVQKKFILGEKTENFENLSQKLINSENNDAINKNDEMSIMFIESLSSLNSWKNNEIENKLFKEINWNLEKRENENDEESLISHYIFPQNKIKDNISSLAIPNLSSSQSSVNSNSETEDGEEEKEKILLSSYKLGICRIFEYTNENRIKSNIVKKVNGNLYKIYSQGNPYLIKEKCRKETIPENFHEIAENYKKNGFNVIGLAGKKMKMNYIQSQRVERAKCESNMVFLGFVVYKEVNNDGYKSAYS